MDRDMLFIAIVGQRGQQTAEQNAKLEVFDSVAEESSQDSVKAL